MLVYFYNRDGSEQCSRFFVGGRSYYDQIVEPTHEFAHGVGDVITYHVGHGVMRDYVVEAVDERSAFVRSL